MRVGMDQPSTSLGWTKGGRAKLAGAMDPNLVFRLVEPPGRERMLGYMARDILSLRTTETSRMVGVNPPLYIPSGV